MKFTSEDLLNAMGLKLNDKINFNGSVGKVYNDDVFGISILYRSQVLKLEALIGIDFTIIQPKPTLTEDEKVILRNLPKAFKWVVRDKVRDVDIFFEKPERVNNGFVEYWEGSSKTLFMFSHLFQFIKWEDEPYSIEELLKE